MYLGGMKTGAVSLVLSALALGAAIFALTRESPKPERTTTRTNRVAGVDFQPDPAWRSGINVGIVQPLMQGFGDRVTEAALELEKRDAARSQDTCKPCRTFIDLTVGERRPAGNS